tara:strand:+ start:13211 stop:13462 length:252 start_codon:yes stop_codon:yes gene_type:complete
MSFWKEARKKIQEASPKEEIVDLQAKLSKLELTDINYIFELMTERTYRGREIEQATTTYLKVKFIKAILEQGESNGEEEVKSS